ncbi:papain-like cysteine protease family protein [Hyalangium versicolor]|uniref:papain-like cysteine protease family protein n=1 Tax=Hyalangium versicolor TaxID=2861190 RepID=UPI001CCE4072|nr:papain-like cysteine protease family protein [Hyalangium versicolor]
MPLHIPRTISSSAHSAADPGAAKNGGWKHIPHIEQLSPNGANEGYVNGELFCGPAVVAMLARGANRQPGMTDARLIQELSQDLVSPSGSTPEDLMTMLERVNLHPGEKALSSTYKNSDVQRELSQGTKFIAQVEKVNPKTGESSAHYILVRGMTPDGNYRISDPLAKHPQEISPQKLRGLVGGAPPDGGLLIPVKQPRYVSDTPTPDKLRGAFDGTRTQEHSLCGVMANRERRHDFEIDIDYVCGEVARNGYTKPVTPRDMTSHEFADRVLWLKRKGNPEKALALLSLMQGSPFPRDQHVFDRVIRAELRQPGIGKKTVGIPG